MEHHHHQRTAGGQRQAPGAALPPSRAQRGHRVSGREHHKLMETVTQMITESHEFFLKFLEDLKKSNFCSFSQPFIFVKNLTKIKCR